MNELIEMLERRGVVITNPDDAAECCGMPRDEDGFCTYRPGHPIYVEREAPYATVIRVHHGNPDAHAESWSDGWDEAHRQGIGGAESREWVIRQVKPILGAAAGFLAPQIADAVLSEADLAPKPDTAMRERIAEVTGCHLLVDQGGAAWCDEHGADWPCQVGQIERLFEAAR